jgi:hypothetical protein
MATDEWEDDRDAGISNGVGDAVGDDGGEIQYYARLPYPAGAWNRDPGDDSEDRDGRGRADRAGLSDDDDEFAAEILHAANAWFQAVELLVHQGFAPDDCEAEIMKRCSRQSRHHRALIRQIEQEELVYGKLAADESLCSFPWGRLCPDHGNTLREGRRGTYCTHEGCELRWPVGHKRGHCDLPAVVVIPSAVKKSGEWRLCAGHRRLYPAGPVLRTLPTPRGDVRHGEADRSPVTELRDGTTHDTA